MVESRYNHQILVEGIGEEGQKKIRAGRVALVGVGALGSVIADQIVRAGIGFIRLIDSDIPELTNLQRQSLINENDVKKGKPKVIAAAEKLALANSQVEVESHYTRLDASNAHELLKGVDLVLDGTDNFETRYLLNRVCVASSIPWIFGGVLGASGMCLAILPGGPCLECAIGSAPAKQEVPTTAERGVLAPVIASIGSLEVIRAFKILIGHRLSSRLVVVDLWTEKFRAVEVKRDERCPICAGGRAESS